MVDFSKETDQNIANLLENYTRAKLFDDGRYRSLLEEKAKRDSKKHGLSVEVSLEFLKGAAEKGFCVSYSDLARANNVSWSVARPRFNGPHGHLDRLLEVCHARHLPLLTAICVNKDNVVSGELDATALSGFAAGARRVGYSVVDERAFHEKCRDDCWEWGRRRRAENPVG
jgi:hypothetical protein